MGSKNKFDMWIERSISRFMELTDEIHVTNDSKPKSGFREEALLQPTHLLAEANDYLSINDWLHKHEDYNSNDREE
jgi:hypothetical protein